MTIYLEWPEGMQESIVAELGELGIDESLAEMATDIVASRLVAEIGAGRLHVSEVQR